MTRSQSPRLQTHSDTALLPPLPSTKTSNETFHQTPPAALPGYTQQSITHTNTPCKLPLQLLHPTMTHSHVHISSPHTQQSYIHLPLHTHNSASLAAHAMQRHYTHSPHTQHKLPQIPPIIPPLMTHTILHDTTHMITHKAHPTHTTQLFLLKHIPPRLAQPWTPPTTGD